MLDSIFKKCIFNSNFSYFPWCLLCLTFMSLGLLIILLAVLLSMGGVFWGLSLSGREFVIMMSGTGVTSLGRVVVIANGIVLIDFIIIFEEKKEKTL